jgi:gamma-glutamyltranspeptidase/glutathione hydrolase
VKLPDHARTLQAIGESQAGAFYRGDLARKIDAESRKYGGYLRYEDLAAYEAAWVEPIRVNYRGYEVCEIPPNGQGIAALIALNILKEFDFPEKESIETYHRQIEAMKMAFSDSFHFVTDPARMIIDYHTLLRPEYGARRAAEMTDEARVWTHRVPPEAELFICAARTAKATWYPLSSPIIWDSAPGSWLTGQASLSRTEARISRWIRTTSIALCPASEPITRSFPVF